MGQPQQQPHQPQQHVNRGPSVGQSGEKVSVACKLPCGFIMRGFVESEEIESSGAAGGRTIKRTYHRPNGDEFKIEGTSVRMGMTPPLLIAGYRITHNVPKSLADQWFAANANSDLVKNKIVCATRSDECRCDDIEGWAREHETSPTGLEGIDPANPGKKVRGITRGDRPN